MEKCCSVFPSGHCNETLGLGSSPCPLPFGLRCLRVGYSPFRGIWTCPSASSLPQPVYKADLLPCSTAVPGSSEPVLPRTRQYSEMVAAAYVRFRDTDLV